MSVLTAGKQKDSEYSAEKTDLQTSDLEPVCDLLLHKERFAPYVHNYGSYGQYIEDFVNYLYPLKEEGKLPLIKKILNCLWGALSQLNIFHLQDDLQIDCYH